MSDQPTMGTPHLFTEQNVSQRLRIEYAVKRIRLWLVQSGRYTASSIELDEVLTREITRAFYGEADGRPDDAEADKLVRKREAVKKSLQSQLSYAGRPTYIAGHPPRGFNDIEEAVDYAVETQPPEGSLLAFVLEQATKAQEAVDYALERKRSYSDARQCDEQKAKLQSEAERHRADADRYHVIAAELERAEKDRANAATLESRLSRARLELEQANVHRLNYQIEKESRISAEKALEAFAEQAGQANAGLRQLAHFTHCDQNEHVGHCKYGDDNCPALPVFRQIRACRSIPLDADAVECDTPLRNELSRLKNELRMSVSSVTAQLQGAVTIMKNSRVPWSPLARALFAERVVDPVIQELQALQDVVRGEAAFVSPDHPDYP